MHENDEITVLLEAARDGDRAALDQLFARVYEPLRALSHQQRRRWEGDHTMNTTALVHEAYLKLVRHDGADWRDRAHFFAVASRAMRQILVNYAERRRAKKRGGGVEVVPLEEANPVSPEAAEELLVLDEALQRLESIEPRRCRVVECRFFAGLAIHETAEALGVSVATVKRDWTLASAWLRREVRDGLRLEPEPGAQP
jgi:RNA polymerase sigma factor (TIGR02999 family)